MTCPDCGTMTVVTKTDRFTPDAPTRRLRTCECGFRGVSIENWERRLGSGANLPATQGPVGGNVKGGNSSLIRNPNPYSPGNPERARAKSNSNAETEAFRAFYTEYPRKKKRPRALRAWFKQGCEAIADVVMAGLRRQLRELRSREVDKIPYPASWLNDREWEDPSQQTLQAVPKPVDDTLVNGTNRVLAGLRAAAERKLTPEQLADIAQRRSVG